MSLPSSAVVHVHVAQAFIPEAVWLASRVRGFAVVAHVHLDVGPSGKMGWILPAYKRYMLGPTLREAERVIVLNRDQQDMVESRYGVTPGRVVVLPNGVSKEFTLDRPVQPAQGFDRTLHVLFVGRLNVQKNVPRLVRAIGLAREPTELTVVGDGEDRAQIERLIADLGLSNVRLVGAQRGAQLLEWYRWADIFVLPSDQEGMPLVVLEAMAAGLPVIGTDVPGLKESLTGVGLVVQPNPSAVAAAIDRLAGDARLRADLAAQGREHARSLSWAAIASRLEQVYQDAGRS